MHIFLLLLAREEYNLKCLLQEIEWDYAKVRAHAYALTSKSRSLSLSVQSLCAPHKFPLTGSI